MHVAHPVAPPTFQLWAALKDGVNSLQIAAACRGGEGRGALADVALADVPSPAQKPEGRCEGGERDRDGFSRRVHWQLLRFMLRCGDGNGR